MIKPFAGMAFAAALLAAPPASADTPAAAFTDDACPAATPLGRHLNAIDPQSAAAQDDILATAKAMVGAYRDCVMSFDNDARGHQQDASNDYVVTHRMYARLALARSLQRVASSAAQLHDPASAKREYDAALQRLAEMETIGVGAQGSAGTEGRLLRESRDLHDAIVTAEKALPPMPSGASPAPSATP